MIILLILVGAVALVLAGLLFQARSNISKLNLELDIADENAGLALDRYQKQTQELEKSNLQVGTLNESIVEINKNGKLVKADLHSKEELLSKTQAELLALTKTNDDLAKQILEAERKIVDLAARPDVVLNEMAVNNTNNATALWQLEVLRSERQWRNSVATNPVSDVSPFPDTDDQVRLAIEVEAAALREDVGAYVNIDWQAEPIKDPARSHLVVRVAQELLAAAAKSPGASTLVVSGDKELTLKFAEADSSTEEINLIAPSLKSDLVDITSGEGLTVTVKS